MAEFKSGFETRLAEYVALVQQITNEHFARNYENLTPDTLSIGKGGRKYVRIVRDTGAQRMVHSFVEVATGDVLKAAGWKAPAKHARGNIWDNDTGRSALTITGGVRYL